MQQCVSVPLLKLYLFSLPDRLRKWSSILKPFILVAVYVHAYEQYTRAMHTEQSLVCLKNKKKETRKGKLPAYILLIPEGKFSAKGL